MSSRIYLTNINRIEHSDLQFVTLPQHKLLVARLPNSVDLRTNVKMPPVYDQGNIGSCTANALVAIFQFMKPTFYGSRLFLYYNERKIENDISNDSGASFIDGIMSLQVSGLCSEKSWPYIENKFAVVPTASAYREALNNKALQVKNIRQDITSIKTYLSLGLPFVVGISVFEEFESDNVANTGYVPMPTYTSQFLGGHAVVCCGYTSNNFWIMRNSWGKNWGAKGYFYLPFQYLLDSSLSSDLWGIQRVQ